jgi:hypothetical protein
MLEKEIKDFQSNLPKKVNFTSSYTSVFQLSLLHKPASLFRNPLGIPGELCRCKESMQWS